MILSQWNGSRYILVCFFLLTGFTEAVWGVKQLYGYTPSHHSLFRTTGSFFNPGPYAGYLALVFPIALYYVLKDYPYLSGKIALKRYWPFYLRWGIAFLTFIFVLIILPATMSRASWLGSMVGCGLVTGFFVCRKYKISRLYGKHKKKILTGGIVGMLIGIIAGSSIYNIKKDSADGRFLMWKVSSSIILKHPMGVGLGNFSGVYGEQQAVYFASGKGSPEEENVAGSPESAFNEYLQLCIETGIIPFFLFLIILGISFIHAYKMRAWGVIGSLASLLIFAGMSYPFSVLPFLIALSFLLAVGNPGKVRPSGIQRREVYKGILFFLLCCMAVGYSVKNRSHTYQAYVGWNRSKILYNLKVYESVEPEYEELYPFLNDQVSFLFEYGHILSNNGKYELSNDVLEKAARVSADPMIYNIMGKNHKKINNYYLAEQNFIKSSCIVPHRIYPYYLLANLYKEMGQEEKARGMALFILEKDPKVDSPAVQEMKKEMKEYLENKE